MAQIGTPFTSSSQAIGANVVFSSLSILFCNKAYQVIYTNEEVTVDFMQYTMLCAGTVAIEAIAFHNTIDYLA